jgi:hypothetical protein
MVESAAHLVDHVFPEAPVRQWVLTFPFPLRFLFANDPNALSAVLTVVHRARARTPRPIDCRPGTLLFGP